MLCPAAGSSARLAGCRILRGLRVACSENNVVLTGVPPQIMSMVTQVAVYLMMHKPFRSKQYKDEELSGVLGRKEGRKWVSVEP